MAGSSLTAHVQNLANFAPPPREESRRAVDRSRPLVILLGVLALACTDPGGGYRSDEISTPVGDFDVRGTLWLPVSPAARAEDSPERHAAVLIVPDGGPIDRNGRSRLAPRDPAYYHAWAEELVARDVAVLRYDKRFLTHPSLAGPGWGLEDRIEEPRVCGPRQR